MNEPQGEPQNEPEIELQREPLATPSMSMPTLARTPEWGYDDLAFFLGGIVPSLLVGYVAVLVFRAASGTRGSLTGLSGTLLAAQFIGYIVMFTLLALLLHVRYAVSFWESLHWRWPEGAGFSLFLQCFGVGIALALGVNFMGLLLHTPSIKSPFEEMLNDPANIALLGAFATVLGPASEELVFHGFVLPLFARTFGAAGGILCAAIPFALLHGSQYSWKWQYVAMVGAAGIVFGWVRVRTGSTLAAAVVHAAYNFTFFAGSLFLPQATN